MLADHTKEVPGPLDAFETAKPDEPIFTLQGGDPLAAPLVLAWAVLARLRARVGKPDPSVWDNLVAAARRLGERDEAKQTALLLRATEAETVAWAMQDYRAGRGKAAEVRATYSGDAPDAATLAALGEHTARMEAARLLTNSDAEVRNAAEVARAYGLEAEADELVAAAEVLKRLAPMVRPARAR